MAGVDGYKLTDLGNALDSQTEGQILEAVQSREGGPGSFLDELFNGMCSSFDGETAGDQEGTVRYEIGTPEGVYSYTVRIADRRCTAEHGGVGDPRATISIGLVDFLRLRTGKLNGMQAFITGRIKVTGDLLFTQSLQGWFKAAI
jgi:putative sterol carrier protein